MIQLDLSKLHIPYRYDERAAGRKLLALTKYVGIIGLIICLIGFYFLNFEKGYISNDRWSLVFGFLGCLLLFKFIGFVKLHKFIFILTLLGVLVSYLNFGTDGFSTPELGLALLGSSGLIFIISLYMYIKGDVLLKSYKQEYPFRKF